MTKIKRKTETEMKITLTTMRSLMGESFRNLADDEIDGVILNEEFEIIGFDPSSITLRITRYIEDEEDDEE